MEIKDLAGNVIWKYDSEAEKANFKQTDPYTLEHVNWINCIRGGKQIEQASETAISNMAASWVVSPLTRVPRPLGMP